MIKRLNQEARKALKEAMEKGIIKQGTETEKSIVETVEEQEVVSFCSSKGCVTFDKWDVIT